MVHRTYNNLIVL